MKNISIPDELAPYILGILQLYGAQQPAGVCNRIDTAISPEGTFGDDTLEASGDYISFLPSSPQKGGKEETEQEEKDLPPTPPIEKEEIDKEERGGEDARTCSREETQGSVQGCSAASQHASPSLSETLPSATALVTPSRDNGSIAGDAAKTKQNVDESTKDNMSNVASCVDGAMRYVASPPEINFILKEEKEELPSKEEIKFAEKPQTRQLPDAEDYETAAPEEMIKNVDDENQETEETASAKTEKETMEIPPRLEDLRAYFNVKKMKNFTPEQFFDYYETRNWSLGGGVPMRNWKACMRNWNRKHQNDFPVGCRVADFREFLDKRCPMPDELTKEQETYLEMYAPGNQYLYGSAEMVDYVLREKKMPLRQCLGFVGRVVVERAIMQNLDDLRTFCDVPQWRFSNEHVYNVTQLILNNYSYWKTGELMLALQRLKAGKHGIVDNRLSPTILLARLCTYEKWRLSQVNQRGR